MTRLGSRKKWDLTQQSLRGLLEFLDPDADRAGEQYEKVREKLIRFFEWKGCIPGDEFADEALDRVARKLEAGLESRPQNPYLYIHGVAVNVIRERWRKTGREARPLPAELPAVHPDAGERDRSIAERNERRLDCLEECIAGLGAASRELLTAYHLGGRKGLAAKISVPSSALRLRVYRIRRSLERCVVRCESRNESGNDSRPEAIRR